jgi:hypothetical protein
MACVTSLTDEQVIAQSRPKAEKYSMWKSPGICGIYSDPSQFNFILLSIRYHFFFLLLHRYILVCEVASSRGGERWILQSRTLIMGVCSSEHGRSQGMNG